MTKTKKRGQPEFNRNFNVGDLAELHGEEAKVFRVEGFREVNEGEQPIGYAEYYIMNVDTDTGWWDIAYDEDLTLLAKAEDAAKFLRNRRARERRKGLRRGGRKPLTTDDLLSDLHSFIEIRRKLPPGPMFDVMGDMIQTVKAALKQRTGGDKY